MTHDIEFFEDSLINDLSWRKRELQTIKMMILKTESIIFTKAYILLLYSHWEGFIKKSSLTFLEYICNEKLKLKDLQDNFLYLKIKKNISECFLSNNNPSIGNELKLINKIRNSKDQLFYIKIKDNDTLKFINTEYNLSSKVFKKILITLGVKIPDDFENLLIDKTNCYRYKSRIHLIDFLLNQRNAIAHGDNIDEDDINDILNRSSKILDLFNLVLDLYVNHIEEKKYIK